MALSYKSLANSAFAVNLSASANLVVPTLLIRYLHTLNLTGFFFAPAPHRAYRERVNGRHQPGIPTASKTARPPFCGFP